jgi:hypothetical protein
MQSKMEIGDQLWILVGMDADKRTNLTFYMNPFAAILDRKESPESMYQN